MGGAEQQGRVGQGLSSLKHPGSWVRIGNDFIGRWQGWSQLLHAHTGACISPSHTFLEAQCSPSVVWSTLGRVPSPPTYKTWVETGAQDGKPVVKVLSGVQWSFRKSTRNAWLGRRPQSQVFPFAPSLKELWRPGTFIPSVHSAACSSRSPLDLGDDFYFLTGSLSF